MATFCSSRALMRLYGPQPSSIGNIWDLIRNVNFEALSLSTESEALGMGPSKLYL